MSEHIFLGIHSAEVQVSPVSNPISQFFSEPKMPIERLIFLENAQTRSRSLRVEALRESEVTAGQGETA